MQLSPRPRRRRVSTRTRVALAGVLALTLASHVARAQTTYNFTGPASTTIGGSLWSSPANWMAATGTGTTYPSTSNDNANLNDTTANRIVTYDSTASGLLGTLNITETSAFNNEVAMIGGLLGSANSYSWSIKNNFTLGASTGGTSTLFIDAYSGNSNTGTSTTNGSNLTVTVNSGNGTVTLNSGGVLELLAGATSATAATSATLNSNVLLQGGVINADRGLSQAGTGSSILTVKNLTMTSGTINLSSNNSLGVDIASGTGITASNDARLYTSNFQATGGTINQLTGGTSSAVNNTSVLSEIFMQGANNFMANVTFNPATVVQIISAGNQSFYSNVTLNTLALRTAANTNSTPTAQTISTKTVGASDTTGAALSTGTLMTGQISFTDSASNQFNGATLLLGSNITVKPGAGLPIHNSLVAATESIDTGRFTLDLTGVSTAVNNNSGIFAPVNITNANGGNSTSGATTFILTSSAAGGTIKALGFDLSQGSTNAVTFNTVTYSVAGGVNVTGAVTLQATGGPATANNLNGYFPTAGGGAISSVGNLAATSTFLYSGTGTQASPATLTATNRTIGMLAVSAGFLQVNPGGAAPLTTGGAVSVTGGGLDISGTSYGALTLNAGNFSMSNATLVLTLGGSFDTISATAGAGQSFSLSNVIIALNGANSGTTYQVFNNFSGTNTVSNVTFSNVPAGETASIDTTGLITFATAVPEPGTWVGGVLLVAALGLWGRRRYRLLHA